MSICVWQEDRMEEKEWLPVWFPDIIRRFHSMEQEAELQKPPFDKPVAFIKMFDAKTRAALIQKINEIKENAVKVVAG